MQSADDLARALIVRAGNQTRMMVGVAGPPGSGKSTLADTLRDALIVAGESAVVVPMDGFHFDDIILNRRGHRPRKGAPHTFDVAGFEVLLKRLRACEPDVAIPVFDRTMELSRAAADIVNATDRFMIVEGNYLLLKSEPWVRLKPLFDVTLFLDVPLSEIERRLTGRILAHGHDQAYAKHWIELNDMLNVREILANSAEADIRIDN